MVPRCPAARKAAGVADAPVAPRPGMTGNWWAITLRGAAGMLFGALTLAMPGLSLAALVLLFGVYAIAEGGFTLVAAARGAAGRPPSC